MRMDLCVRASEKERAGGREGESVGRKLTDLTYPQTSKRCFLHLVTERCTLGGRGVISEISRT
jgi:hypothetical protein